MERVDSADIILYLFLISNSYTRHSNLKFKL